MRRVGKGAVVWGWPLDRSDGRARRSRRISSRSRGARRRARVDAPARRRRRHFLRREPHAIAAQAIDARFRVAGREAPSCGMPTPAQSSRPSYAIERRPHDRAAATRRARSRLRGVPRPRGRGEPECAERPDHARSARSTARGTCRFRGNLGAPAKVTAAGARVVDRERRRRREVFLRHRDLHEDGDAPPRGSGPARGCCSISARVRRHRRGLDQRPHARHCFGNRRIASTSPTSLQPGENRLEIKVTNQWTNRLVGDRRAAVENAC